MEEQAPPSAQSSAVISHLQQTHGQKQRWNLNSKWWGGGVGSKEEKSPTRLVVWLMINNDNLSEKLLFSHLIIFDVSRSDTSKTIIRGNIRTRVIPVATPSDRPLPVSKGCLHVACLLLLLCVLCEVQMNTCPVCRLAATHCFPYVKKRIAVMYQHQTDLSPIEVAIDEMSAKVAELRLLCSASEVDMIRLQLKLQGSVSVQVRTGAARKRPVITWQSLIYTCATAGQCGAPRLRQSLPRRQQCQEISRQQSQTA